MTTRFVEANGLRFEVEETGVGDHLALCLHGFPEHLVSWRNQVPVLAAMGYRVWAINQRGYGRSSRPTGVEPYALRHLLADVAGLIDASGARRVTLIAHDWGAMVAWCFAAGQIRPIDRLVIMNVPHPLCFRAALKRWRQRRKSWYVGFFQLPYVPERMLAVNHGAAVRRMMRGVPISPEIADVYARQLSEPGAATAMLNWYRAMRLPSGVSRLDAMIEVPTLVIWGEDDVALDLICLDGTERYVRDLRIERLPGISHWVQQHAPDQVNALLRDFLHTTKGPALA